MSKCLKCGAELPPVGECTACTDTIVPSKSAPAIVPSLLNKDIQIDRRLTPERTPAVSGTAVPTFADLSRPATPPGLTPARQSPAMPPAQRLPVPPPMPAATQASATPHAMPPPQRLPIPAPGAVTPPQRLPIPSPMPAPQATAAPRAATPPQRLPVPPSPDDTLPSAPPPAAQHVPPPGAHASVPTPLAASEDPDTTAPGQPLFSAPRPAPQAAAAPPAAPHSPLPGIPAPATLAQASASDPDDTAPGNPPFSARPPVDAPSTMATAAQRAELPVPSEAPLVPPPAPQPVTGARLSPAPVPVVTFPPPASRTSPPPAFGTMDELTPRLPYPAIPPNSPSAQARGRSGSAVRTASGVQEIHARPASLWRRVLSFTIDAAALVGVATLYIFVASAITGAKVPSSQGLTALDSVAAWMHALKSVLLPGVFLLMVLSTAYCTIAAFLWNGRTLGRLLLGLRLVDTHGVAPAPTRSIIRALLSVLSFGLFLGGFWMALFDRRGQTLHDKLTSTFVIQPS